MFWNKNEPSPIGKIFWTVDSVEELHIFRMVRYSPYMKDPGFWEIHRYRPITNSNTHLYDFSERAGWAPKLANPLIQALFGTIEDDA